MMNGVKLVFRGGPWDGVQFDAPFAVDEIRMKFSTVEGERNQETKKLRFKFRNYDHHVYQAEQYGSPDVERMFYDYQPELIEGKTHGDR